MLKSKMTILMAPVLLMAVLVGAVLAQESVPVQISALAGEGTVVIWDDVALSDAITFAMTGVTPAAAGTSYEGWVKTGSTVKSTGVMTVKADGSIDYTFGSGKQVLVPLKELNSSGQSGWAVVTVNPNDASQTDIALTLSTGTLQTELVHIHTGQCGSSLGGVAHGLTSFDGGSGGSITTVDATLISLRTGGFAINTHEAGNASNYTACGNIPTEAGSITFALNEMSNSGSSGWATLIADGSQTDVVLNISAGVLPTELVHIHGGQCGATLAGVEHGLTSFGGGSGGSFTTVNASLSSLRNGGFAVNTHQAGSPGVYTNCGNIPAGDSVYSGENLIHNYDEVVITIEPVPDNDPGPSGVVAFSAGIDASPITHIRHLLSDWPGAPGGILGNLQTQLDVAILHASLARNQDTIAGLHQHLEHVVNIIEGTDGPNFGDLDGDGSAQNPGDGTGVLSHAVDRKHAGFAAGGLSETSNVVIHSALVDEFGMNAHTWAGNARDQALAALGTSNLSLAKIFLFGGTDPAGANTVVTLLDAARNGSDVTGEGGAAQAYVEAQLMATYTFQVGPPAGAPDPTPTPTPQPTATPVPDDIGPPVSVGDTTIPLIAQIGLALSLVILAGGGVLVLRGRRSRIRT